jgi:hypothetical protein
MRLCREFANTFSAEGGEPEQAAFFLDRVITAAKTNGMLPFRSSVVNGIGRPHSSVSRQIPVIAKTD